MICFSSIMLVYLVNILFSAAVSAIPNGGANIVYPSIETARSGEKIIKFRALNEDIHLILEPANYMISDDFVMMNGANEKIDNSVNIERIKRSIYKDKKTGAVFYIDEESPGTINGTINSQLKIEPQQSEKLSKDGRIAHRVSEIPKTESDYLIDEIIQPELKHLYERKRQLKDDECVMVETVYIIDSKLFERFNNHGHDLVNFIVYIMTEVQRLFDSLELGIYFVASGIKTLNQENETTEAPYIKSSLVMQNPEKLDGSVLFQQIRNYYCGKRDPLLEQADLIIFMSGREFLRNKNGTYVRDFTARGFGGGVCLRCINYVVIPDIIGYGYRGIWIIAHVLGHLLGSVNDGNKPYSFISNSPSMENCSVRGTHIMGKIYHRNATTFSQCSRQYIQKFLTLERAKCIIEKCSSKNVADDIQNILATFLAWASLGLFFG